MESEWDAIVVGASFGGLAAAMELAGAGRVLLIDRQPIGEGETSACGTLLRVLERLDALDALEQSHEEIVLHLAGDKIYRFRPAYPFATFDYRTLCEILRARTDAAFLQASVTGLADGAVTTSAGSFRAPIVIDASGWRAALGSARARDLGTASARSLGVELRLPVRDEGLHLWVLPPQIGCGVTWLFPAGEESRVGIACYRGKGGLKDGLEAFLDECLAAGELHGGFFPSRLRDPIAGSVFLVGDAAGQCLPLTGEGIRPALVFGQAAGRLARRVLDGRSALPRGPLGLPAHGACAPALLRPAARAPARASSSPSPGTRGLRQDVRRRHPVGSGPARLLVDRGPGLAAARTHQTGFWGSQRSHPASWGGGGMSRPGLLLVLARPLEGMSSSVPPGRAVARRVPRSTSDG